MTNCVLLFRSIVLKFGSQGRLQSRLSTTTSRRQLLQNLVHPRGPRHDIDKSSRVVKPAPWRVSRERHPGASRRATGDLVNQEVENRRPDSPALMLRQGRHIGDQKVPTSVTDHTPHPHRATRRVGDMPERPGARERSGTLFLGFRCQSTQYPEHKIIRERGRGVVKRVPVCKHNQSFRSECKEAPTDTSTSTSTSTAIPGSSQSDGAYARWKPGLRMYVSEPQSKSARSPV